MKCNGTTDEMRRQRPEMEAIVAELCESARLAWEADEVPFEYGSERGWHKSRRACLAEPALAYLEYAGVYDALPIHPLWGEKEGVALKFTFCQAPASSDRQGTGVAVYRVEIED
jgi:hypothetical protein